MPVWLAVWIPPGKGTPGPLTIPLPSAPAPRSLPHQLPSPGALTRCPHLPRSLTRCPSLAPSLTREPGGPRSFGAIGPDGTPGRGDDDPPTTRPGDDPGTGRRRRNDVAAMRQRRCGGDDAATTTTTTGRRRRRHHAKFYCMRLPQSRTLYTETFCGKRDLWTGPVSQDVVMIPSGCSMCLPFV